MPVKTWHVIDTVAVKRILESRQGPVARDLMRRGLRVESQAKRNLGGQGGPKRVDTGRLRSSVATQLVLMSGRPVVRVGTNVSYAMYVHDGTGVFGPRGRRITPVRAKLLKFTPRGVSRPVYARSVAGMAPNRFLKNALKAARG